MLQKTPNIFLYKPLDLCRLLHDHSSLSAGYCRRLLDRASRNQTKKIKRGSKLNVVILGREGEQTKQTREQISKRPKVLTSTPWEAIYREKEVVVVYVYCIGGVEYYKKILKIYKQVPKTYKQISGCHN